MLSINLWVKQKRNLQGQKDRTQKNEGAYLSAFDFSAIQLGSFGPSSRFLEVACYPALAKHSLAIFCQGIKDRKVLGTNNSSPHFSRS